MNQSVMALELVIQICWTLLWLAGRGLVRDLQDLPLHSVVHCGKPACMDNEYSEVSMEACLW